jgi:carbonic anhydrase
MLQNLSRSANKLTQIVPEIKLLDFIQSVDMSEIYFYGGSMTTPPCSEIVDWIITNDPMPISDT